MRYENIVPVISSPRRTLNIFSKETCTRLWGMEPDERRAKLAGVITAFFQGKLPNSNFAKGLADELGIDPELAQKVVAHMQQKGMTGPSDAGDLMNLNAPRIAGVFYTGVVDPLTDFGFEELFQFVDMRKSGQTEFDIIDVANAITFEEKKSGQRMKVYGITTGKSTVSRMEIAAAIGIEDAWINYAKFWNLNQAVVEARSKAFNKKATDHYALLTAISSDQNQAFDTDDIKTINNACAQILNDLEGKGFGITGNESFVLRANISLKERIEKALTLTFNSYSEKQVVFNVERKYTTKLINTSYYVGIPGKKTMTGDWEDLSAETDRDILLKGTDVAYSMAYNCAIGEEDQWRRCSLS